MLNFEKAGGLISAIAQDVETGEVLMIAWMNQEAFDETVRDRKSTRLNSSHSS